MSLSFSYSTGKLTSDSGDDFVEFWRINGTSAAPVAHFDLDGHPANVVWYS